MLGTMPRAYPYPLSVLPHAPAMAVARGKTHKLIHPADDPCLRSMAAVGAFCLSPFAAFVPASSSTSERRIVPGGRPNPHASGGTVT